MPKEIEQKLKKAAKKRGFRPGSDKFGAYVYGTLNKIERGNVAPTSGNKKRRRKKPSEMFGSA